MQSCITYCRVQYSAVPTTCYATFTGLINTAGWMHWFYKVRPRQPYVWKGATSLLALNLLLSLELLDFPPLWWTLDAHALWHAGTFPLPLLWGRCCWMQTTQYRCSQSECSCLMQYSRLSIYFTLACFFSSFVIDDCLYLTRLQKEGKPIEDIFTLSKEMSKEAWPCHDPPSVTRVSAGLNEINRNQVHLW